MIWTFDNQTGRWRSSTVENTAVQTNFYTVETADGTNDEIEALLGRIESAASAPYEMLMADTVPSGQAKADFAMFLATLHLRTPAMVNAIAAAHAEMMDLELDQMLHSRKAYEEMIADLEGRTGRKRKVTYEQMREFAADKSRYRLAVTHKLGLKIIAAADEIAPVLFHRGWFICHAKDGHFITSDHPVFRWVPRDAQHEFYGDSGFRNVKSEVTLPLSPNRLLLVAGTAEDSKDKHPIVLLDRTAVDGANELRAFAAERYVYAHERSDAIADLALKYRDDRNRITISGKRQRPIVDVVRRINND